MKRKPKYLISYLAAIWIALVLLVANSYAQQANIKNDTRKWHNTKGDIMQTLNLTPQQKEAVKKLSSANREARIELRNKLQLKRLELKQELEKTQLDKIKIDALAAQIKAMQAEQFDQRINSIIEMKKVLTPEQFKKLQERDNRRMRD